MGLSTGLYLILACIALLLLVVYRKMRRAFRCVIFTAFTGLLALGIVWFIGRFIPLPVSITPFSMVVSTVLGIPGVLTLLVFRLL